MTDVRSDSNWNVIDADTPAAWSDSSRGLTAAFAVMLRLTRAQIGSYVSCQRPGALFQVEGKQSKAALEACTPPEGGCA